MLCTDDICSRRITSNTTIRLQRRCKSSHVLFRNSVPKIRYGREDIALEEGVGFDLGDHGEQRMDKDDGGQCNSKRDSGRGVVFK